MTSGEEPVGTSRESLVERRARQIASARSVTLGLAVTFLALGGVGAIVMRLVDQHNFPSLGLAVWWALQTVTTVGYGDVVPTTDAGKVVGGIEMVLGVSFFSFLTAVVTSTVIQRGDIERHEAELAADKRNAQVIVDALARTHVAVAELDSRLERIETRLFR